MKAKFLILLFAIICNYAKSQCSYAEFSDAPKELFRKRFKPDRMRYGNPYTMFSTTSQPIDEMLASLISN